MDATTTPMIASIVSPICPVSAWDLPASGPRLQREAWGLWHGQLIALWPRPRIQFQIISSCLVDRRTNSTRIATAINLLVMWIQSNAMRISSLPYDNPCYTFHSWIVEMVMDCIKLQGRVSNHVKTICIYLTHKITSHSQFFIQYLYTWLDFHILPDSVIQTLEACLIPE